MMEYLNRNSHNRFLYLTVTLATILAFVVIVLGAYTRLTGAGLGCPDWPGCYGHLVVSQQHSTEAITVFQKPLEVRKAWTEMIHRYAAGSLGLFIFMIAIGFLRLSQASRLQKILAVTLVLLVFGQALLGMWTVTLQLLPLVVMGHLLGGFTILALVWWLRLSIVRTPIMHGKQTYLDHFTRRSRGPFQNQKLNIATHLKPLLMVAFFLVIIQIALGGWVSANYAGLACIGFPGCNGQWWPQLNFIEAFNFFSPLGINYEGGALESMARITIQMVHRVGAIISWTYLFIFTIWLWVKVQNTVLRKQALIILSLISLQFILGIINVTKLLPLPNAVAHNAVAALLLLSLVSLLNMLYACGSIPTQHRILDRE